MTAPLLDTARCIGVCKRELLLFKSSGKLSEVRHGRIPALAYHVVSPKPSVLVGFFFFASLDSFVFCFFAFCVCVCVQRKANPKSKTNAGWSRTLSSSSGRFLLL